MNKIELMMYSQPNCGLCEEAKLQLELAKEDVPFTYRTVNITEDDLLLERFQLRVPVIMYHDEIIQEGIIDFVTVTEALAKYL
ncbi:glutaredoxin family protein [Macrococcus equipercicus]|uniref:Glutaredoxin family protein n=1 Tax=Macrococcus equipercicus TaxID=69967 RepID=A0ABQ6RB85_9STAP|nr:glutaredoxin family protein [Macrococcus equipercicus]KAA1042497.1 glutaredoxin family protein [Macrococcus equipercicus]